MIDIEYYIKLLPQHEDGKLLLKIFGDKDFKSLSSAKWFFEEKALKELDWMKKEEAKLRLMETIKQFIEVLKSEEMPLKEKIELTLDLLDKDGPHMDFLDAKGINSITCICPKCKGSNGKGRVEKAWIPANGTAKSVKCNHRSSCGFSGDFIACYAEQYDIKYGVALNLLAKELGIDFTLSEVQKEGTKKVSRAIPRVQLKAKKIEPIKIKYTTFDKERKIVNIDYKKFLDKFDGMSDEQKFKMIVTAIWEYSLTTKQWAKEKYFKEIGISKKNPLLKEKVAMIEKHLGFLFKTDIPPLVKQLTEQFPFEELVRFGVLAEKGSFKQVVTEGLIVIPNFDLYSNLCTGLKYRKTKYAKWIDKDGVEQSDKNNKEPELSFGRIANPLPYHLTRESLLDESIIFRFFEGQKDLHSMPLKKEVCDVAIPGTNGISQETLGLFKGRIVELYFDQDEEGQKGALILKTYLESAGAIVINKTWDVNLGGDVNDVLQAGNILKII